MSVLYLFYYNIVSINLDISYIHGIFPFSVKIPFLSLTSDSELEVTTSHSHYFLDIPGISTKDKEGKFVLQKYVENYQKRKHSSEESHHVKA